MEENNICERAWSELERLRKPDTNCADWIDWILMSTFELFKTFMDQGHTNLTATRTMKLFERLIDFKPLTAIEDEDFEPAVSWDKRPIERCTRYPTLRRERTANGNWTYSDFNRSVWREGSCMMYPTPEMCEVLDELYPISLPYIVPDEPYKIYATRADNNKIYIGAIQTPEGDIRIVNRIVDKMRPKQNMAREGECADD